MPKRTRPSYGYPYGRAKALRLPSPLMGTLARRVLVTSDAERKRLERALHDGAQQRLVAATTTLGLALRRLESGEEGAPELVEEAAVELAVFLVVDEALRGVHNGNEASISVRAAGGELLVDVHGAGVAEEQLSC